MNNCADNLEWVTRAENEDHAFATGLKDTKGEKNPKAVLNVWQVRTIRQLAQRKDLTQKTIAEFFGINPETVSKIKLRQRWRHI